LVCYNKQIGQKFYRLGLEFKDDGAKAFANAKAGQFLELDLSKAPVPKNGMIPEELKDSSQRNILLRRPFSFSDIETKNNVTIVEITYCVVGPATVRMSGLKEGDSVTVLGPLGNGFWIPDDKRKAVLVAGGIGTPPLQHLAKEIGCKHKDIETTVLVGARSKEHMPFEGELFSKYATEQIITTDDGTFGRKGFVTEPLIELLDETKENKELIIYSCGPGVMLAKVAEIADKYGADCQVSLERRMACGIGLCQGCAVECKVNGTNETVYKMCCKDGPVFDSKEVVF